MPSIEGRRPSRSPAACRAAPSPTRLAVEPPDVNVPTKLAGNPSRSMSQRIARSSTRFAGVAQPLRHRLDEVGHRPDRRRRRGHPAAEPRVPDAQPRGDDLVAKSRKRPLGAEAGPGSG